MNCSGAWYVPFSTRSWSRTTGYAEPGGLDKEFWRKAGKAGILGSAMPEELGGAGGDFIFNVIVAEEFGRSVGSSLTGSSLMADIATHILTAFGSPEQ